MATLEFSANTQKSGSVAFTSLQKPIKLRLDNATIVYEPGIYQGTGEENRVNIVFSVPEHVQQEVQAMETALGDCVSCLKDGTMKCKVSLDRVRFFDVARNRIEKPGMIRGYTCNAMVNVRGKWSTRNQQGLCLEATDIQLLGKEDSDVCPF